MKNKEAYIMKLEMITEGLTALLLDNNYNPVTIHFYEREWKKIHSFLTDEYGDTEFCMESGLKYLENQSVLSANAMMELYHNSGFSYHKRSLQKRCYGF